MDRIESLEERIAHLTRMVEDLSDVVARQSGEIDRLTRLTGLLAQREAGESPVGRHGLALRVAPPAGGGAVGSQGAGVFVPRHQQVEGPRRRRDPGPLVEERVGHGLRHDGRRRRLGR